MSLTSKANEMRALGEDIIVLTVGEPDFDTPQYIKDAGQDLDLRLLYIVEYQNQVHQQLEQ